MNIFQGVIQNFLMVCIDSQVQTTLLHEHHYHIILYTIAIIVVKITTSMICSWFWNTISKQMLKDVVQTTHMKNVSNMLNMKLSLKHAKSHPKQINCKTFITPCTLAITSWKFCLSFTLGHQQLIHYQDEFVVIKNSTTNIVKTSSK
jgi:hypothetical protein